MTLDLSEDGIRDDLEDRKGNGSRCTPEKAAREDFTEEVLGVLG